jgi:hypothetical protein
LLINTAGQQSALSTGQSCRQFGGRTVTPASSNDLSTAGTRCDRSALILASSR